MFILVGVVFALCNIFSYFHKNLKTLVCAWNHYSKQLPVISSVEYKQVVTKVGLSKLFTSIERRKYTFLKARLAPSKKPHCMVIW